jgi:hypothetical protein
MYQKKNTGLARIHAGLEQTRQHLVHSHRLIFFFHENSARFTLLFSHANAEDLGHVYEHLKTLSKVLQVMMMCVVACHLQIF